VTSRSSSDLVQPFALSDRQTIATKQTNKHYASLFSSIPQEEIPNRSWQRRGTGIIVRMIQHRQLTQEQLDAIGEYRLDQYILAGLYDLQRVTELGLTTDPNFVNLPDSTIHLLVGDAEYHLLCYASFEPAHIPAPIDKQESCSARQASGTFTESRMSDSDRPLFSVEFAFGHQLYAIHPGVSLLPVASVREMMRMVRNQAIRAPLTSLTTIEVIVAASHLLRNPIHHIEALVGCASPELRQLSNRLNIPVAYAPEAVDHLREHSASLDAVIWTPKALEPGRFWPLAISLVDIQTDGEFFDLLDAALDGADLRHILKACREVQCRAVEMTPYYCYTPPSHQDGSLRWVPF
jgi:hypothetical protein